MKTQNKKSPNLKSDKKRKTGNLGKITREKTFQIEEEQKRKSAKKDGYQMLTREDQSRICTK